MSAMKPPGRPAARLLQDAEATERGAGRGVPLPEVSDDVAEDPSEDAADEVAEDAPEYDEAVAPVATSRSHGYGILWRRALHADLDPIEILPEEAPAFDVDNAHGDSEPLKRILVWRRAALFVAFLFQLPPVLVRFVKAIVSLASADATALAGLEFVLVLLEIGVIVALLVSMRNWARWRRSRKILLTAWIASFVAPFLMAFLPLRTIITHGAELNDEVALGAGLLLGFAVFIELAPKILALIPGILRAAIIAKAAFPTSPMPGWLMMVAAPFDALLMCAVLSLPYQMESGGWMLPAIVLLTFAPVFFYRGGKRLSAPHTLDEALAIIKSTRRWAILANVIGGLCLLIGLAMTLGRIELAGHRLFSVFDAVMPIISLVAGIFILEVVGIDILLGAMIRLYDAQTRADDAAARTAYEAEMGTLVAAIRANG